VVPFVPLLQKRLYRLFFPSQQRGTVFRYTFAVASVAAAFCVRWALAPLLLAYSPLLLFMVPVAATAITAGFGPAMLATVLGAGLGASFFYPYAAFSLWPDHMRTGLFQLAIFGLAGLLIALLGGELRNRRWEAEATAESLRTALAERDAALERVHVLTGLLPICAACKSIRDEYGHWRQMEAYISSHSDARFSHGMCPDCARKWYGI
jgi:K+-sensing histidine kinase KdpD